MDRRLLPYEYQLIEALGVTKEEYLRFVAIQRTYADSKVSTALDVRNGPGAGTAALVLTIIGTLFQVGAALLAPKPQLPDQTTQRQPRNKRLAPRFGFNSSLELASYGDPVSLVYTNTAINGSGGVRVNGSLVWSAVETIGGNHFAQLLVVLGAGNISKIDPDRTALGQLPLSSYQKSRVFLFFKDQSSGLLQYKDNVFGGFDNGILDVHPINNNRNVNRKSAINLISDKDDMINGYSQTFSPSSLSRFGAYDPVPINVDVISRNSDGNEKTAGGKDDKITINNKEGGSYLDIFSEDKTFDITIPKLDLKEKSSHEVLADEIKQESADSLDMSALYMLGTAKYRLKNVNGNPLDLASSGVAATFECIEAGRRPTTDYNRSKPYSSEDFSDKLRDDINDAIEILSDEESGRDSDKSKVELLLNKALFDALEDQFNNNAIKKIDFDNTALALNWTQTIISHKNKKLLRALNKVQRVTRQKNDEELTSDSLLTVFNASKEFQGFNAIGVLTSVAKTQDDLLKRNGSVDVLTRQGSIGHTIRQRNDVLKPQIDASDTKDAINEVKRRINKVITQINNGRFDNVKDLARDSPANGKTWEEYVTGVVDNDSDEPEVIKEGIYKERLSPRKTRSYQDFSKTISTLEGDIETLITGGGRTGENRIITLDANKKAAGGANSGNVFSSVNFDKGKNIVLTMKGVKQLVKYLADDPNRHISDWMYNFTGDGAGNRSKDQRTRETARVPNDEVDIAPTSFEKRLGIKQRKIANQKRKQENFLKRGLQSIREWHIDRLQNGRIEGERRNSKQPMVFSGPGREDGRLQTDVKYPFCLAEADIFLDHLPENGSEDVAGGDLVNEQLNSIISEKRKTVRQLTYLVENWERISKQIDPKDADDNFFTKCLSKIEIGLYSTVSSCDFVVFNLKATVFRQVSGRQSKYGKDKVKSVDGAEIKKPHTDSDNGVKHRITFFKVACRRVSTEASSEFEYAPVIFALRRASKAAQYAQISFKANNTAKYEFKFEPVVDFAAEILQNGQTHIGFIENQLEGSGSSLLSTDKTINGGSFFWHGRRYKTTPEGLENALRETRPLLTNEWDMFSVRGDTKVDFSFNNGPEFEIVSVSEQQKERNPSKFENLYENLSMMGVHLYAGRNVQDVRAISAFVTKGKACRQIDSDGNISLNANSSSYAPDIFLDTILDENNGVARYLPANPADTESLALAKKFCRNNNLDGSTQLFMDGVIAEASSWREFWIENAPLSLLELARKNGKDTLVPALPVDKSGRAANYDGTPVELKVNALFTPGNILEGSYKEEFLDYGVGTQDIAVTVLYRETGEDSVFSSTRAVNVKLSKDENNKTLNEIDIVRQTVDASQFVTQRSQAILIGKLLCNQRRHIRRGIEFQTFPSEAAIEPGSFVYVDVGLEEWDNYTTGSVMARSVLNFPLNVEPKDGTYTILLYRPETGDTATETKAVTTSDGVTTAVGLNRKYEGYVFVMGKSKPSKRVFRVTEVAIEEGGEVSVKAIEYPCNEANGVLTALIADFRDRLENGDMRFTVS